MDTSQWPQQGIGIVEQVENSRPNQASVDKKLRPPPKDQAVNCPRCNSTNTKFCYYNNYSLTQPRYLCKTCRRYWTAGGSLRNVPVGGGSRKNKRPHSSSNNNNNNSSSINSKKLHSSDPNFSPQNNPNKIQQGQDLNLAYNPFQCNGMISSEYATLPPFGVAAAQNTPRQTDYHERQGTKNGDFSSSSHEFSSLVPPFGGQNALRQTDDRQHGTKNLIDPQNPNIDSFSQFSMMELLKSGSRGLLSSSSSFMSVPVVSDSNTMFSSGLSFTLDGVLENGSYGNNNLNLNLQNDATNSSRMVLPFEELKHVSSTNDQFEQDKGQAGSEANGSYWNGMLTGGSW